MQIKKFGGSVTTAILGVTNVLVMGENPGKKKVVKAHEKRLKIINIEQLNGLILGDFTLDSITTSDYPEVATAVLDAKKIQVQRHPQSSVHQEQAQDRTAGNSIPGQQDEQGLATAMVTKRMAYTTGTAASGVNTWDSSAVRRGAQPLVSRWLLQQAALYHRISCISDSSITEIERDQREPPMRSCLETLGNSEINLKQ